MSPQELQESLKQLTPEDLANVVAQLSAAAEEPEIDSITIKMQLISFVKDLIQQNMALEWEINKRKPVPLTVDDVITNSQALFDFVTSRSKLN